MSNSAVANIEIGATTNRLTRGLATARRAFQSFAVNAARGVSNAFGKLKLGDVGKTALGTLGGNLAARGIDSLMDGANAVRDFERSLIRYQIASNGTAQSTAEMRAQVRGISKDTAISSAQVLAGASQYVALTGDADGARVAMRAFADVATASGASVSDVATATASLRTSMGLDAKDIEAAFSGMIIQGKEGAVEIKDLAGELANLAPQFAQFRGAKGLGGIRELGAGLQVVMKGAGSSAEAATQMSSLIGELAKPEVIRKLKAIKVDIFDKDPKTGLMTMRNASDIFKDLAANQKLADPRVVAEIFGRKEAQSAIRSIRSNIDLYGELRVAAEDTGAVQRDKATFLESDAGRLDAAFNRVKVAIAEAFTPERITGFTNAVESLADKMGPVVDLIGRAGDLLGGIMGIGKSVRGALEGPANPFQQEYAQSRLDRGVNPLLAMGSTDMTKGDSALQRNARGWEDAKNRILGAEQGERVSKDSIRAAFIASRQQGGFESVGAVRAGGSYLRNAGVTNEQATQAWTKDITTSNERGLKMIAEAIRNMNLEVGKSEVTVATQKSAKHAQGVKK